MVAATAQKNLKLNNGNTMPAVGLGTWNSEPGKVGAAVKAAVQAGYRHLDLAAIYGNEPEIGAALQEIFADASFGVSRKDLFITSKLWCTAHRRNEVKPALQKTLADLQLDYLDLYLMHLPIALDSAVAQSEPVAKRRIPVPVSETWAAMEECVDAGLTRSLGVSNFATVLIYDLLGHARIRPAVHQLERHPYHVNRDHREFCREFDIVITAYSALGTPSVKKDTEPHLLSEPVVAELAQKYGKTPAQVLIRWAVDDDTTVIPKSVNPSRIEANLNVFDFELSKEESAKLSALDRRHLFVDQKWTGINIFS